MARINIEDSIFKDERFIELVVELGSSHAALGALVKAWMLAQKWYLTPEQKIPLSEWKKQKLPEAILKVGLATLDGGKVWVSGSHEQFSWLLERREAGKRGGLKSQENRTKQSLTSAQAKSSKRNPLSLSPSLAPSLSQTQNKQKDIKQIHTGEPNFFAFSEAEEPQSKPSRSAKASGSTLGSQIFEAYAQALLERWSAKAVRNAKVNSLCAQLAKRLGEDALSVVRFYVKHNDGLYLRQQHPIDLLVRDAESLHVQWQRGRAMTTAEVRSFEKTSVAQSQIERIRAGEL